MRTIAVVLGLSLLTAACGGAKQTTGDTPPAVETSEQSPLVAACDAGTARSCLLAANAEETQGNTEKAAQLYNAACELGDATGCALAGGLLAEAEALEAATAAFDKGCALDDATSCYGKALVLAGSFGGEADIPAAIPAFERGCALGLAAACGDLGSLYHTGQGVELDLVKAEMLRKQACEGGDGESCMHLGLAAWQREDRDRARALFEQSCGTELPDPTGCGYYGWILWTDEGDSEHAKGIALMDASCEAESAVGCSLRAATYASMGDMESGQAALKKACELDAESCERFSAQYKAALEVGK